MTELRTWPADAVERRSVAALVPYARNALFCCQTSISMPSPLTTSCAHEACRWANGIMRVGSAQINSEPTFVAETGWLPLEYFDCPIYGLGPKQTKTREA
jgi:hypothetical protein